MISFVWSSKYPFLAGAGGSENYTAGQIRELHRRGIPARIITIGHGENDGRDGFPDIHFTNLPAVEALSELDDTLVFVTYPLNVTTKRQSYAILHCPPVSCGARDPLFDRRGVVGKKLIAPSKFAGRLWARELGLKALHMPVAYPFAENEFGIVKRPANTNGKTRILFAGRLTPDKGVYTLLAALHMPAMQSLDYELTVTTAGNHSADGQIIEPLLRAHPRIKVVDSRRNPQAMAQLMAEHDVVVMPSSNIFWQEIFGIASVEAQHAGCRVVVSKAGGLPETNCGGMIQVKPDDPQSLAFGIARAAALGPLPAYKRQLAASKFTVAASVDQLLKILGKETVKSSKRLLLPKNGAFVREQLDLGLSGLSQLGNINIAASGITRNQKLS